MLQGMVFDFDGVIADTEPLHYRAFLEVLEPLGIRFDYETYGARYIGFDDREGFEAILHDHGRRVTTEELRRLIRYKLAAFERIVAEGVVPYPGVVGLLSSAASELAVGICSGARAADVTAVLAALDGGKLRGSLRTVVTADDVRRSKPDPESYRLAAERMALPPSACLAVEDTPPGIESARAAGLHTLALTHTHSPEALHAADRVVDRADELRLEDLRTWFG